MITRTLSAAVVGFLALACGKTPALTPTPPVVSPGITERGTPIYVGRVFPLHANAATPTYVYERRVDDQDGQLVSTHVTRDPAGAIQLAEAATHTPDYALSEYTLYANQFGQRGTIHVANDEVTFRLDEGSAERTKVEQQSQPVVVGPTLVGFIVRHLDALEQGETLPVRFAVLDRLETIGFELKKAPTKAGQTRVEMNASSFLYNLVIPTTTFTFDKSTRKLARLEGRVPPKVRDGNSWADFDASVEYDFVAASYR